MQEYERELNLSIGDTTHPLPQEVVEAMAQKALSLATDKYTGYGCGQGDLQLRRALAKKYNIEPDEVFISDGAKCDLGRLQLLFGRNVTIAVQDPAYPVYIDTSALVGQQKVIKLPCTLENGFFPELQKADIFYFCSPHNPTGYAATHDELERLVHFAKKHKALIVYDSAYADFIQDDRPRSIFEIEGADEVAIEVGSFSKSAGFAGVRLGWSVIPKKLTYEDGRPLHPDWLRIISTFFNAASNIAQAGGLAALNAPSAIPYYQENARLLKEALSVPHVGGDNSPYIWAFFGDRTFEDVLEKTGVLGVPGAGFGPSGKGFLRFSALAKRETVEEAARRLHEYCRTYCRFEENTRALASELLT